MLLGIAIEKDGSLVKDTYHSSRAATLYSSNTGKVTHILYLQHICTWTHILNFKFKKSFKNVLLTLEILPMAWHDLDG